MWIEQGHNEVNEEEHFRIGPTECGSICANSPTSNASRAVHHHQKFTQHLICQRPRSQQAINQCAFDQLTDQQTVQPQQPSHLTKIASPDENVISLLKCTAALSSDNALKKGKEDSRYPHPHDRPQYDRAEILRDEGAKEDQKSEIYKCSPDDGVKVTAYDMNRKGEFQQENNNSVISPKNGGEIYSRKTKRQLELRQSTDTN